MAWRREAWGSCYESTYLFVPLWSIVCEPKFRQEGPALQHFERIPYVDCEDRRVDADGTPRPVRHVNIINVFGATMSDILLFTTCYRLLHGITHLAVSSALQ